MKKNISNNLILPYIIFFVTSCATLKQHKDDFTNGLDYCVMQATKTASGITDYSRIPRSIANGKTEWRTVDYHDWTCGFWPGIEWYLYEYTGDSTWKTKPHLTTSTLAPLVDSSPIDHDLGFMLYCSYGNGYRRRAEAIRYGSESCNNNHFRPDYTSYHVVVYDTATGKKVKGITHQGYADNSMWARGQSWAIYGFTMCYRESRRPEFLDFAQKVTDVYLQRLPADLIPYWDFDAPDIPNAPRDASAACVVASALLKLSTFVQGKDKANMYRAKAKAMLKELSSPHYQSGSVNNAFLLHSTGHKPAGGEIDASIIYADYYYIEALLRAKKLKEGKSIYSKL